MKYAAWTRGYLADASLSAGRRRLKLVDERKYEVRRKELFRIVI